MLRKLKLKLENRKIKFKEIKLTKLEKLKRQKIRIQLKQAGAELCQAKHSLSQLPTS